MIGPTTQVDRQVLTLILYRRMSLTNDNREKGRPRSENGCFHQARLVRPGVPGGEKGSRSDAVYDTGSAAMCEPTSEPGEPRNELLDTEREGLFQSGIVEALTFVPLSLELE